ncbi:Cytochrome c-type biogenesis protein CcmE [bacterium HR15]|nr:Cytochrome c-type biogenesis protein CcmE [bacterium HR15]
MKFSSVLVLVLIVVGLVFTVRAFVENTSPYVKVRDLERHSRNVHVALTPIKETIRFDLKTMTLTFEGKDETGVLKVVYPKGKPNNFEAATQVVVIGDYKNGIFEARDMLVKCPSKYQGTASAQR